MFSTKEDVLFINRRKNFIEPAIFRFLYMECDFQVSLLLTMYFMDQAPVFVGGRNGAAGYRVARIRNVS